MKIAGIITKVQKNVIIAPKKFGLTITNAGPDTKPTIKDTIRILDRRVTKCVLVFPSWNDNKQKYFLDITDALPIG